MLPLYDNELIDIVQVDQFRQDIERQRANLLATRNSLELELDRYKTNTLGLPPDIEIELDESLIRKFQLIPREATEALDKITNLQQRVGDVAELIELLEDLSVLRSGDGGLNVNADVAQIRKVLEDIQRVTETVENRIDGIDDDLAVLDELNSAGQQPLTATEQALVDLVKQQTQQESRSVEGVVRGGQ